MERSVKIAIALAMMAAVLLPGCGWVTDILDEDDEDEEEAEPYRFLTVMEAGASAAIVDPYDGSLDLLDPINEERASVATSKHVFNEAVLADGQTVAVLDDVLDEVRIVDVASAEVKHVISVGSAVSSLIPSPYGSQVLAIYDPSEGETDFGEGGVINYFELNILDAEEGTNLPVSIDFTPENIAFSPDGHTCLLGRDYRLIHLDMDTVETVTFPLSLGPNDPREPRHIEISPDGEFAMILVDRFTDVYVLNLVDHTINILDLAGSAGDIVFIPETRIALLPVPELWVAAVVDLDSAIPEEIALDFPATDVRISPDGTMVLFYADRGNDVAIMDLADWKTELYPLTVSINRTIDEPVCFDPDSLMILAVGQTGAGDYGIHDINLIDLDSRVVVPIGLEGTIYDYAFSPNQQTLGFVLPEQEKFVRLDLLNFQGQSWDLGRKVHLLHYLPTAEVYMVDYHDTRGKLTFIGDRGSDLFWCAKAIFDY